MNTWRVPRESKEWVGPITVAVTIDGTPASVDPSTIQLAVIPKLNRPIETDWQAPVPRPGGTDIGVQADPVTEYAELSIWVRVTAVFERPVLERVATLVRT